VSEVTTDDVRRYLATKAHLAPGTVAGLEAHLASLFKHLYLDGKIARNPIDRLPRTRAASPTASRGTCRCGCPCSRSSRAWSRGLGGHGGRGVVPRPRRRRIGVLLAVRGAPPGLPRLPRPRRRTPARRPHVPTFEIAQLMGTSVEQIGATYGHVLPNGDRRGDRADGRVRRSSQVRRNCPGESALPRLVATWSRTGGS
jgi:hypothetical protein